MLLELGGKAPMVVLADADLDRAAAAASFGAFFHQGQICMSTERIVVDRAVADALAEKLAERARALPVGDPREPSTAIGPLINEAAIAARHRARRGRGRQGRDGAQRRRGRRAVLPADRAHRRDAGDAASTPRSRSARCVAIVAVDGPDEAVAVANDTEYGLSAAVFSENVPAALELAQRIESGICHINDTTVHDEPQMPFGGVKASGFGRFGGRAALEEFTELRWITVQEQPREYPI